MVFKKEVWPSFIRYTFVRRGDELFTIDLCTKENVIKADCIKSFPSLTVRALPAYLEIWGDIKEITHYKELKEKYKLLKGRDKRIEEWHNLKWIEELRKIIDFIGSLYGL